MSDIVEFNVKSLRREKKKKESDVSYWQKA